MYNTNICFETGSCYIKAKSCYEALASLKLNHVTQADLKMPHPPTSAS